MKFKIVCKACGFVLKQLKDREPFDSKCTKCNEEKMALEPLFDEEIESGLTYDILIICKETNKSMKDGICLNAKDRNQTLNKQKQILIKKISETLVTMLRKQDQMVDILTD